MVGAPIKLFKTLSMNLIFVVRRLTTNNVWHIQRMKSLKIFKFETITNNKTKCFVSASSSCQNILIKRNFWLKAYYMTLLCIFIVLYFYYYKMWWSKIFQYLKTCSFVNNSGKRLKKFFELNCDFCAFIFLKNI